ncbi:MAG: glucose-1-phosphate cytidylyltransferase [Mycobacterium sp.]
MKVAILAGGVGSRLAEETILRPKPMVEIGDRPILWHIMKHYSRYGYSDFVIAAGYKSEFIKRWMLQYAALISNLTINVRDGSVRLHDGGTEDWRVDIVDTGEGTNTGGRIKRLRDWVGDETFMLTWGDGVSNVNLDRLLEFHRSHGKLATMTAVRPPARFGHLVLDGSCVTEFSEKPQAGEGWINGAFFVLEPEIFDYIDGDSTQWELEPMEHLAKDGELMAYLHQDFWQCMDTLRDKRLLEDMWASGAAPWKTWS